MLQVFDVPVLLREFNLVSTFARLMLAVFCGGVLGIERGIKRRPAGFRTYMLVCMGSALVMITNQYICTIYSSVDPSRMGAQVVSGIGFLGAGTIMIIGRNKVKGLTTAAGLWAAACVGLSIGVGYYEGGLIGCLMIFTIMALLHRLDDRVILFTRLINVHIGFKEIADMGNFMEYVKENHMKISDMEITRSPLDTEVNVEAMFTLELKKRKPHYELIQSLSQISGVKFIEEI